jgi:hypothetical protein
MGAFYARGHNNILRNVGGNGSLPGEKAADQHMCTQHIDSAGIPARLLGHSPHCSRCEYRFCARINTGLLQAMPDVGQTLTVGERWQHDARHRKWLEWLQERGTEMPPEFWKTYEDHLEQWFAGKGFEITQL